MRKLHRCISTLLATGLSLGLLLFVAVNTVFAHAAVINSNPKAGSTITKVPSTVQVTTAENMTLKPTETNLFVYDPKGTLISIGDAKVDINNPIHMSVAIKTTSGDGVYVVRWITKSADDGDPAAGAFYFTVNANGAGAATTGSTNNTKPASTTTSNTSSPVVPVILAAVIALLVGLGAGFGIGRARPALATQASSDTAASQKKKETTSIPK